MGLKQRYSKLESTCEELRNNQDVLKKEIYSIDKGQSERLSILEVQDEMRQEQVDDLFRILEVKEEIIRRDLEILKAKIESIALSDGPKNVVFDAPEQNKWFTGREEAIEKLERFFTFQSVGELQMAALCGLGGCGKTTLGAQFAWKHKGKYEGGVFWISMEDDKKLEKSMNDLALRLGILADTFDLTLSKVLTWISRQKKRWLLVLDDVDQLHLSEQMHKVLSGRWKRQAGGHILLTTRREPKVVCESMDLEETCCVEIFTFSDEEAKSFLATRCEGTVGEFKGELDELVRELGCLPLALEQAGAHIKAVQCSFGTYLVEYKKQRLKLLNRHPRAKPSWEYESNSRLAVHTTWLLNFEYVRKSSHGEVASRFMEAAAFLEPNEIQDGLINLPLLSNEKPSQQECYHSVVTKNEVVEILTKFSLFQRKGPNSFGLHRLVQEVIRSMMTVEETASSLLRAVNLLYQAFQDCPSPDQILLDIAANAQEQPSTAVNNPSLFFSWSQLTYHSCELQKHIKDLIDQQSIERDIKTTVLTREASRIVYENAVQLSVHGHHEEAKETERFAFQILNSCKSDTEVALTLDELKKLFPHTLPIPQLLQKVISYSSCPSNPDHNQAVEENDDDFIAQLDRFRLRGNSLFKEGRFEEAVETYTEALETDNKAKNLDPRLLNNRATAYLKLGNYSKSLSDSEEYVKLKPNCWKGYTRKALALNGLEKKGSALCLAAMAYYHEARSCRRYEPFHTTFKHLDGKWEVVDSSEALRRCIIQNKSPQGRKKVLLLTNEEYEIEGGPVVQINEVTHIIKNLDGSNDIVDTTLTAFCDASDVTINCSGLRFSRECFLQNISFITQRTIFVAPDGLVEFTNCRFKSTETHNSAVVVYGTAKLINCTITDSPGGGITVEGFNSSALLEKCEVMGNGKEPRTSSGIKVFDEGSIVVTKCLVHGNTEGILVSGTRFNDSVAKKAHIQETELFDNKFEGVRVSGHHCLSFDEVVISRNRIYHNGGFGIEVSFFADNIVFEENMVFENFWWGVWVQRNSGGSYKGNEICNNKMGGIRVGKRSPGKPPCVVECNVIHDNRGPAFYEGLKYFEECSFPGELHYYFERHENFPFSEKFLATLRGQKDAFEVSLPGAVSALYKSNNHCYNNGSTQMNLKAASSKANCAFCFRNDVKLLSCKGCMTSRYCGKECQKMHWGKHRYMCQAMGKINTIEVKIPVTYVGKDLGVTRFGLTHPSLEPTGPKHASPPPRDGRRFVVKLQTWEGLLHNNKVLDPKGYVSDEYNPQKAKISIYDRSRSVDFEIRNQPKLYHLIMECGMMGSFMYLAKKLFCWAVFKDEKTLQIISHEFPPVQRW